MAAERFYIHRCGDTVSCALTAAKLEPRLPPGDCPASWQFWMQVTHHQVEDGEYGFAFAAAICKIQSDGFFLFTGTPRLLSHRIQRASLRRGPSNV